MEGFTRELRRLAQTAIDLIGRTPPMVLVSLVGAPLALAVSLGVAVTVAAEQPVAHALALPAVDTRGTWDEEVEAFSRRLEEGFGLRADAADDFSAWILEASDRQQIPEDLIASLIYTESTFRTRVRSWSGAIGPAQVKPRFWTRFCGGVDLADPEQNVYCGAQIVAHYMAQCGDFDCALRLYNVGPANLRDPYYAERSHLYLAKIEDSRSRFAAVEEEGAPAAAAF